MNYTKPTIIRVKFSGVNIQSVLFLLSLYGNCCSTIFLEKAIRTMFYTYYIIKISPFQNHEDIQFHFTSFTVNCPIHILFSRVQEVELLLGAFYYIFMATTNTIISQQLHSFSFCSLSSFWSTLPLSKLFYCWLQCPVKMWSIDKRDCPREMRYLQPAAQYWHNHRRQRDAGGVTVNKHDH